MSERHRPAPCPRGPLVLGFGLLLACVPEPALESDPRDEPRCLGANAEAILAEAPSFEAAFAEVRAAAQAMDPATFAACHPRPEPATTVAYDPLAADYLDLIQTRFPLDQAQTELLANHGFVVLDGHSEPTFEDAYAALYDADMPLFISSDSLLYALHRSFDRMLVDVELEVLAGELRELLTLMHARLASLELPSELIPAAVELDVFLTVGRRLMDDDDTALATVFGDASQDRVEAIMTAITAAKPAPLELFGVETTFDYSQFLPRGHYIEAGALQDYFRTLMWLGRAAFPLVSHPPNGGAELDRGGVEAALLLGELLDGEAGQRWALIDSVLSEFMGEPDGMSPRALAQLRAEIGIDALDELSAVSDAELLDVLLAGSYGTQRIASQIVMTTVDGPQVELPQVFELLGQRFAIDSYVLSGVSYDRLLDPRTGDKITRMLPADLDVAFALGSDLAGELLSEEFETYPYQGALHELRFLVEGHDGEFWADNFYNGWLNAIRSLGDPSEQAEYPAAMRTDAWAHKTLETQLASWAELRHDTVLYTEQSYTGSIGCEYPQVYVEPVPSFYASMASLANQGHELAVQLELMDREVPRLRAYFEHMSMVMTTLEDIAARELDGLPLSDAQWQFLRATIEAERIGCSDDLIHNGWYGELLYGEYDDETHPLPTIIDVHTTPTDANGNERGWVLHAGTGRPRYMIFTIEDCSGVQAYVGPVSTYYSKLSEDYERLDDFNWALELDEQPPARPSWATSYAG